MRQRYNPDFKIAYNLILITFLLILCGIYSLYISLLSDYPDTYSVMLIRQILWTFLGILIGSAVLIMDARLLWKLTPIFYGIGLFTITLTLFFYDESTYLSTGAKNWLAINGHNLFQPAEFMKIPYILFIGRIIVKHHEDSTDYTCREELKLLVKLAIVTFPIALLSIFQNDFGTFLVFIVILIGCLIVSGFSLRILFPIIMVILILCGTATFLSLSTQGQEFLKNTIFSQYQVDRFDAWLHPFRHSQTSSFQQSNGLIAVGSGGILGNGIDTVNLKIPVRESDMIFRVIGENFGFVGAVGLLLLYFLLLYSILKITVESNKQFYTYVSVGVVMLFLFHIFENIGAVIGVVPLTGIPLPFLSQGGSAIVCNIIEVSLVLSMRFNSGHQSNRRDHFKNSTERS